MSAGRDAVPPRAAPANSVGTKRSPRCWRLAGIGIVLVGLMHPVVHGLFSGERIALWPRFETRVGLAWGLLRKVPDTSIPSSNRDSRTMISSLGAVAGSGPGARGPALPSEHGASPLIGLAALSAFF